MALRSLWLSAPGRKDKGKKMANISEKKRKMLVLFRLLWEKTDENHALTLPEILQELENQGISAERKSLYDDIETLRSMGVSIETRKQKNFQYYLTNRNFSLADLQFLAQSVALSPQGGELFEKLGKLCSDYQREELQKAIQNEPKEPQKERQEEKLTLEFPAEQRETVLGRFGAELPMEPSGKNRLRAVLRAEISPELLGWLFVKSPEIRLVAPKKLAEQLRERAKAMAKSYKS